jgi:hypothetical protein
MRRQTFFFSSCPSCPIRAAIEKNRSFAEKLKKKKILRMDLQQSGKDTNEPSKGTSGHGGLVGRTRVRSSGRVGRRGGVLVWHRGSPVVGGVDRGVGRGDRRGVDGSSCRFAVTRADGGRDNGCVGLGASARTVGDGQSGGLGDSVGLVSLHDGSGTWAVGGVLGHDLGGGVRSGGGIVGTRDSNTRHTRDGRQSSDDGRETHFDFGKFLFFDVEKMKRRGELLR